MLKPTNRILVFHQTLIVTAQANQKQNCCHILETVYPFPTLRLLPTHIDHEHLMIAQLEDRLRDTDCPRFTTNDILFCWVELWMEKSIEIRIEIFQTVFIEMKQ